MSKTVMPPQRPYARARSRRIFNQLFSPRENGRLHEVDELPTEPDEHHWWTAVDLARTPIASTCFRGSGS